MKTLEQRIQTLEESVATKSNSVSVLCFSDSWDRFFAAFMVANAGRAMGYEVHMFFTFWALCALRNKSQSPRNKSLMDRVLAGILPAGAERAPLSKLHWAGLGKLLIRRRMKARGVDQLDELISRATDMGVHLYVCELAADLLGFAPEDLTGAGPIDLCGVTSFLGHALKSRAVLFI
jgi:peroxiredoxin family protein